MFWKDCVALNPTMINLICFYVLPRFRTGTLGFAVLPFYSYPELLVALLVGDVYYPIAFSSINKLIPSNLSVVFLEH